MHSIVSLLAMGATLASAAVIPRDGMVSDTMNDMDAIIAGDAACRSLAVIFARGTFDSGNVGVWVGPQMMQQVANGMVSANGTAVPSAAQGVDPSEYLADLEGYLKEGGSNAGAKSMAQTITSYVAQCPGSVVVPTGWSQGALVAHKAISLLEGPALAALAGVVTFGDPWHLFSDDPLPSSIDEANIKSYCFTGTIFDPLCADLPAGYPVPTSIEDLQSPFAKLPDMAIGVQEAAAAASLVAGFPGQLLQNLTTFLKTLKPSLWVRLLLTPEHFQYGNQGASAQAGDFIVKLAAVQKLLA